MSATLRDPAGHPGRSGRRRARIICDNRFCEIDGVPHRELELEIPLRPRGFAAEGGVVGLRRHEVPILQTGARGRPTSYAGLVPRIRSTLERRDYDVTVEYVGPSRSAIVQPVGHEYVAVLEPDRGWLAGRDAETREFIAALDGAWRGQILVDGDRDVPRLMAAAIRAFPHARVAVVQVSRARARVLREELAGLISEPVGLYTGGMQRSPVRVHVTGHSSLDAQMVDMILFAQSEHASTAMGTRELIEFGGRCVAYGFRRRGSRLSEWRSTLTECLLGPVIHEVPGKGRRRADVLVLMAESPIVAVPAGLDALERKRSAIWHNGRRNDAVAEVARSLAGGRPEGAWRHGLFLDGFAWTPEGPAASPRVAILVEGREHGRELLRRLPGWRLLAGEADAEGPGPDRAIVTLVHAASLRRLDVDALVRADGGPGGLELGGFPPRLEGDGRPELLLVDFHDDGDPDAMDATSSRLASYGRHGWRVRARRQPAIG